MMDEQFEKIQMWIQERNEQVVEEDPSTKPSDIERRQKQYEKLSSEIAEYLPIYQDFLQNEQLDDEKVTVIREMWSSLIETTTIRQKALSEEIQKNRLLEMLDDLGIWLSDAETEVHSAVNFTSLYSNLDAEKATRRLITINEQAGDKDEVLRRVRADPATDSVVEKLRNGLAELKELIKTNCEDLEIWKSMQDVVKAIDDEICWFKELQLETERRKQKVAKIIDKTTDLMSRRNRPSLYSKIDEIDEKLGQMKELIENNRQISDIRTHGSEKWADYFQLIDELREKVHALKHIRETVEKTGISPETLLAEVKRKIEVLETVGEQMDPLKRVAEEMTSEEMIGMKAAENQVDKLKDDCQTQTEQMLQKQHALQKAIQKAIFLRKCKTACRILKIHTDMIESMVNQKKPTSNFEQAAWHGTQSFVESYERETIRKLKETDVEDEDRKLDAVNERLDSLKRQLGLLKEKIGKDQKRKKRVQEIQDEYMKHAYKLANWLEEAEEDVADVVWFQTKDSSENCRRTLREIINMLRNEKVEVLNKLELLEVELAELNEDVNTFTWYSYKTLATRMERLDQTISDRVRIVDDEIHPHLENEKNCKEAAGRTMCREILIESKKELEALGQLKLDEQRQKLQELKSGMTSDNRPTHHWSDYLELVRPPIDDRTGIVNVQFVERTFDIFDKEGKGWLTYEQLESCLKSQSYKFTIKSATVETMTILDPTKSRRILKENYLRWIEKNETTNIYDDHSDRKLSDHQYAEIGPAETERPQPNPPTPKTQKRCYLL